MKDVIRAQIYNLLILKAGYGLNYKVLPHMVDVLEGLNPLIKKELN